MDQPPKQLRANDISHPELLTSAFHSAGVGMAIINEAGDFVDVNAAWCRITGYMRKDLVGVHCRLVLPAEFCSLMQDPGEDRLGQPIELRIRRKDGASIDAHVTFACFGPDGGPRFGVITITDVTVLNRLEEQRRGAEKMEAISRLAAGAAHGFNNLLTVVSGYAQLLRSNLEGRDPLATYAEEITKAAARTSALTNKLLAFSRRRLGEPGRLDLNNVVDEFIHSALYIALLGSIETTTHLEQGLGTVIADREQLEQALWEVAMNSLEAMPGGGKIDFRTSNIELTLQEPGNYGDVRPGRYVLLAIEDDGEGIDPETRKHLYEPFYTTKGVGKGTGLAMVYGTVQQFGGHIAIDSTPGQGTTVSILLPRQ